MLTAYTDVGDDVIIVGGGFGVTTVVAGRQVGTSGCVLVYEGASKQIPPLKETIELNHVQDTVEVEHAVVGKAIDLKSQPEEAEIISPSDLHCDVLEMDCEGAEMNIIEGLQNYPDVIIVETHPGKGSPTHRVEEKLKENNYKIIEKRKDRSNGHVLAAQYIQ